MMQQRNKMVVEEKELSAITCDFAWDFR